jgi:TonB family protein
MTSRFRAPRRCLTASMLLLVLVAGGAVAAPAQEASLAGGPPYRVGDGVSRPERVLGASPVYTELARRARVTGTVIVEAIIDEQGNVVSEKVLKGLPIGLDQAAVDAIQTWKFKPALKDGKPVKVYYVLTVNFDVDGFSSLGPQLQAFLQMNPEFAELLRAKRYPEAAVFLDRQAVDPSAEPALTTARCHLLLSQNRLEEAWQVAKSYRGPDPFEMLALIGSFAQEQVARDEVSGSEWRPAVIDLGLQATTMALAIRREGWDAMISKARLLRAKAQLTGDPAQVEEAAQLQRQAMELRARARDADGPNR